ncbi:MAG: G/U mismatch-specific DNA glycosylase [Thermoanaerobaculia bacterium]
MKPFRPTPEQLRAAEGKSLPDLIAKDLEVLFCGINPGLYTAAVGHHFARPGNRFWPALFASGFTDRLYSPFEEHEILRFGLGITNLVARATARASELRPEEFVAGAKVLRRKVLRWRPRFLAVLGVQAYRIGFADPAACVGLQEKAIGATRIWLLPSPSGLNAHYTPAQLAEEFRRFRAAFTAGRRRDVFPRSGR